MVSNIPVSEGSDDEQMDITDNKELYSGFMKLTYWSTGLTILFLFLPILVFGAHMNWLSALILTAMTGFAYGALMKLKTSWYACVIAFSVFAFLFSVFVIIVRAQGAG